MRDYVKLVRLELKLNTATLLTAIKLNSALHSNFYTLSQEWMKSKDFERIELIRITNNYPIYSLKIEKSKPFLKTAYCYFDELCAELKLDPVDFSEHYYSNSIDFTPNTIDIPTARFEFYMADDSNCRLITKTKTIETSTIIGYAC